LRFEPTELPGVIAVEPDVFRDARGFFLETYHASKYEAGGIPHRFVQDNHSRSALGTLRGLHAQRARPQGKLIRVIEGEIYDVAVDIRRGSPTFGRWVGMNLSAASFRQLFIPPNFAHGFCVLSDSAQVEYKCTDFYVPDDELALRWSDPELAIDWPVREPILSARDASAPTIRQAFNRLPQMQTVQP
jgi:dTDP-4-dehydrorhamnose 3,5-epimerase